MAEILPLPTLGDVFADVRGDSRTMRVSYHADSGVVVVSLWAGGLCRGSFRLAGQNVDRLISTLVEMKWATAPAAAAAPDPDGEEPPTPLPGVA